jgi:chromatin remodeling complex protein RSC6
MAIKKNETVASNAGAGAAPSGNNVEKKVVAPAEKKAAVAPAADAKQQKTQQPQKEEQKEANTGAATDGSNGPVEDPETYKEFGLLQDQFTTMSASIKAMASALKDLHKKYQKLVKAAQKKQQKKGAGNKRTTNGFATPVLLSDDLCKFLGVPSGTQMGRTDVTKSLTKYIKDNNLQKEDDRRHINPNAALKSILLTNEGDKVTYFNLQKFIKHHFLKDAAPAPTPAGTGAAAGSTK